MARCISPFMVNDKENGSFPVPCGKCYACVARKISEWSVRLRQEDKVSESAYFVTLTYNNENCPISKKGFMTLVKKDVQLFMKLLRYYSPKKPKIKYYAVGEYGSNSWRPHYHIILFNAHPDACNKAWDKGNIFYGTVAAASIGYCLKYICKKGRIPLHANDDRIPEFALMSKGLGKSYLTPQMIKYHEADPYNRLCITIEGGKKVSMARYFKERLFTKEQRQHIGAKLASKLADELEEYIKNYEGNYYWDKAQNDIAAMRKRASKGAKGDKI